MSDMSATTCALDLEYEINRILDWIEQLDFKTVALQFPDKLLKDAPDVALRIEFLAPHIEVHILGDTSYGSCCADVHAASYIGAQGLIHFGPACLSQHEKFPVLYIFEKATFESWKFLLTIQDSELLEQQNFIIAYDLKYYKSVDDTVTSLSGIKTCVLDLEPDVFSEDKPSAAHLTVAGRSCRELVPPETPLEKFVVVYIGEEGLTLTNLMFVLNKCTFFTYNPINCNLRKECFNVNQQLRRRYFLTQKAKDAQLVGILVGTLGVADHLKIIEHIKILAKSAGKKCYTFVVGKLNPNKLANFPEIDCFVAVACPENSLINDKEFYRPVVTPYEFEVAVNSARSWTGDYITDFRQLLPDAAGFMKLENDHEQETDVSLISGQLRRVGLDLNEENVSNSCGDISLRDENQSLLPVGSAYLKQREWSGLEPHVGETPVKIAHLGRKGLAASYSGEGEKITKEGLAKSDVSQ